MDYLRIAKGFVFVAVYCVLYLPYRGADKFVQWFEAWDIATFGW